MKFILGMSLLGLLGCAELVGLAYKKSKVELKKAEDQLDRTIQKVHEDLYENDDMYEAEAAERQKKSKKKLQDNSRKDKDI